MAQTYANLLAHGVTNSGDVPADFELFAGDIPPPGTDQGQAADATAIAQFTVLMHDAEGKFVALTTAGDYATGGYVVGGQPTAADTITVNSAVITFVANGTDPDDDEVEIGTTETITAQNIRDRINSDPELYGSTASGTGTTVTLTAIASGTAGNSVGTLEGVTSASFTVAAATLLGANAAEDVPSGNAVAIAAQAAASATPGSFFSVYISGCFNHEALVWPAGLATLRARKMAFEGTNITVKQLL